MSADNLPKGVAVYDRPASSKVRPGIVVAVIAAIAAAGAGVLHVFHFIH